MAVLVHSHSTFNDHIEFSNNSAGDGSGGGMLVRLSFSTFNKQVEFSGNSAGDEGGGMCVYSISQCIFSDTVLFSGNSATGYGGGMAVRYDSQNIFNGHVEFSNNSVGDDGGGMIVDDCHGTFSGHVEFSGNNAADGGGGMYVIVSHYIFNGTVLFSGNSATNGGGMVVEKSQCTFNERIELSGNSATRGGGMDVHSASQCMFISTVLVSSNTAYHGGGMAVWYDSKCTFYGHAEFSGNSAYNGGGMAVWYDSNSTFNGHAEFSGNSATYGEGKNAEFSAIIGAAYAGGGMEVYDNSHCIFSEHARFSGNNATFGGGMSVRDDSQCTFRGNVEFSGNSASSGGGGVSVYDSSECVFNKHAECTGNSATYGGGMQIVYSYCTSNEHIGFSGNSAIYGGGMEVRDSLSTFNGHVDFFNNSATYGGGMRVSELSQCIFISTALFSSNSARNSGGSLLEELKSNITFLSTVNISNGTAGSEGGGILVRDDSLLKMSGETIMEDNHAVSYGGAISLDCSELRMVGHSRISTNRAKYGGAIRAISSKLHIAGYHHFENNRAEFGGGMALSGDSLIYFPHKVLTDIMSAPPNLNLKFISNTAEQNGGAIWVENICTDVDGAPKCFVTVEDHASILHSDNPTSRVIAVNNTAIAGRNIYGGKTDGCLKGIEDRLQLQMPFLNESNSISSDAKKVCICTEHNQPDCSNSNHNIEVFSGQQFTLTLVGIEKGNGTVQAVILSRTYPPLSSITDLDARNTIGICTVLSYTITSEDPSVNLILYPQSMCPYTSLEVLTVIVKIKPCPPGFMIHNQTKSCVCDDTLRQFGTDILCDINSQSFSHKHNAWIGYDQLIIYHPHCPFDYCTQELKNFTLNSSDDQCRYNRSGFLCGACRENYSLTLGGSKCEECSHVYLVMFIPLALAGVVLVLFLLIFKLTVSMGTINGLIFFANVIGSNSSIFLPPESTVVLRVFIAWLNLDLGIDTCLFDGLDMYIKVWLQFVFPFYVFTLIGIIIYVSQRSTLVTKLLGSNPVAVLATLILVAYAKLLRAVLTVMSFTYIRSSDDSSIAVWLYDGNVKYMSGKHIALVLFALPITLFLIIPYTVILLFAPYLQCHSKNKFLFWINDYRIKAFLHSYYAPLKDKYRSWIGLLLVLRLCLLIVFVSNSLGDPSINVFAVAVVMFFLLCWRALSGIFYTKWLLDALELFFIMTLGLFSAATLYVRNTSSNQRALADTLVGITFIVFVAITVYHGWRQLTDSRWWRLTLKPKWQKHFNSKNDEDPGVQEDGEAGEPQQKCPQVPTTVIELPRLRVPTPSVELREPVMEFC